MKRLFFLLLVSVSFGAQALTIGAYNIRNFDYDERARINTNKPELATIIQSLKVDVLSVEEINDTQEWSKFVAQKFPTYGTKLTNCGGAHGQKLGFLYNAQTIEMLSFAEDMSIVEPGRTGACDNGSRPLAIALFQVKATKQKFFGMTAHLKSGGDPQSLNKRAKQFQIIKSIINELKSKTGVQDFYFAGDLNTTEYMNRGVDYKMLTQVVKDLGMIDLAQNLPCTAYWWGGTDDNIETPSLLDHIIVTPGLIKGTPRAQVHGHCQKVRCQEVPVAQLGESFAGVSDHCPITATIQ